MSETAKPCECGCRFIIAKKLDEGVWVAYCAECEKTGGISETSEGAIEKWNRRADDERGTEAARH